MNKFKGFLARAGTKGKVAVSSAVALGAAALPTVTAFAEETGGVPALPGEGGTTMWETIGNGVGSFVTNVLTPVGTFCTTNEIALAFLSVTFATLGVRLIGRVTRAFGRGR